MKIIVTEVNLVGEENETKIEPTEFECELYRLLKKKRKEMLGTEWRFLIGKIISTEKEGHFSAWVRIITNQITSVADFEINADQNLYQGQTPFLVKWDEEKIDLYKCEKYGSE